MSFKQQLDSDLDTFFNEEEFAVEAAYNGQPVKAVQDNEFLQATSIPGVIVPSLTVYLRADQVPDCKPGDELVMDGKTYYVGAGPMLEAGMWTLTVNSEVKNLRVGA